MKLDRLFHVLVVVGASSTVGLAACSSDEKGGGDGSGGQPGSDAGTGGSGTGGSTSSGGSQSSGGTQSAGGTSSGGTSSGGTSSGGTSSGGSTSDPDAGDAAASGGSDSGTPDATSEGGGGDQCEAVCEPNDADPDDLGWINCNGCCCWLNPGQSGLGEEDGCPESELCCIGCGRDPD